MAKTNRNCSYSGCTRTHLARGLCKPHYEQIRRGKPLAPVQPWNSPASPVERVMRRSEKSGSCIVWTGAQNAHGYGEVRVDGILKRTHRIVWESVKGQIPNGAVLDHKCRNRLCVNVDHLQAVTRKENGENRSQLSNATASGLRGVYRYQSGQWYAQVKHAGKFYKRYATSREDAYRKVVELRNELHTNNISDRVTTDIRSQR